MSVKVSKIYHKLKNNTKKLEELYNEAVRGHLPQINVDAFTKSCRVLVVIDACDRYGEEQNDVYVVLSGIYVKDGDTIIYEGAFEGVEYYTYQHQGEDRRELLYKNLIQQVYNEADSGTGNMLDSYYTDDAIDVLSVFNIYQDERYLYSVGLDMNLQLSEDGSKLHDDEGWRVLTEDNLFIINVSE